MAQNDYLDFDIDNLPEAFQHEMDNVNYNLCLYYNDLTDNFYIDISDENDVPIVQGEKLVYGVPLWNDVNDPRLPTGQIIPLDDDNQESTISKLNFPGIIKLEFVENDPNIQDDDQSNPQPDLNPYGQDPTKQGDIT